MIKHVTYLPRKVSSPISRSVEAPTGYPLGVRSSSASPSPVIGIDNVLIPLKGAGKKKGEHITLELPDILLTLDECGSAAAEVRRLVRALVPCAHSSTEQRPNIVEEINFGKDKIHRMQTKQN